MIFDLYTLVINRGILQIKFSNKESENLFFKVLLLIHTLINISTPSVV